MLLSPLLMQPSCSLPTQHHAPYPPSLTAITFASCPLTPHCPSAKPCCGPPHMSLPPQAWLLPWKLVAPTAGDWAGLPNRRNSMPQFLLRLARSLCGLPFPSCQLTLAGELQMKNRLETYPCIII